MRKQHRTDRPVGRTLRYGGYSALLTAGVLALLVAVNILAGKIPLRVDLTVEGFYTLSEQTVKVLGRLAQPIVFLALYEPGREDPRVDELAKKYRAASDRIELRYLDPYRNPLELRRYEVGGQPPEAGSLIVESGGRFRILKTWELYELTLDEQTGAPQLRNFQAEQMITSAIVQVTSPNDPVLYIVRGHGERELPADLRDRLARDNFVLRNMDLALAPAVPEDATIVLLVSPTTDLSTAEERKLREFLVLRGGRAVIALDVNEERYPNLSVLLASYGIAVPPAIIVEQESVHFLPNQPIALVPTILDHPITSTLRNGEMPVVFPAARPVRILETRKRRVTVTPLLSTSGRAWAQVNLASQETRKQAGDLDGPFDVAVACTDLGEAGERESQIVVFSSTEFLFPPESIGRLPENEGLFLNSLNWLRGRDELIAIQPRSISSIRYQIGLSAFQFFLFAGIAVILVPLTVFAAGLAIWLRRRHA